MKLTENELLSEKEVAAILKVSRRTLQQWRYLGKGPPFLKIGLMVRYPRAALEDWLESVSEGSINGVAGSSFSPKPCSI